MLRGYRIVKQLNNSAFRVGSGSQAQLVREQSCSFVAFNNCFRVRSNEIASVLASFHVLWLPGKLVQCAHPRSSYCWIKLLASLMVGSILRYLYFSDHIYVRTGISIYNSDVCYIYM